MDQLSHSHKNDILVIINDYFLEMGVCYVPLHHSFIRDYLLWLEGWLQSLTYCVRELTLWLSGSFEIICRGWKVGLADHMMHSFYK